MGTITLTTTRSVNAQGAPMITIKSGDAAAAALVIGPFRASAEGELNPHKEAIFNEICRQMAGQ